MRRAFAAAAGAMGLIVAFGVTGSAVAAKKPRTRAFTQTDLGAQVIGSGTSFESAYKLTDSLDGNGAAVQVGTVTGSSLPLSGTSKTTDYFANGVTRTTETFTLGAPNAAGISTLTGSGKCTGGTGVHKKEKCTFTFTGTYNTNNTVTSVVITGKDTK
jgi:hypothetical protein